VADPTGPTGPDQPHDTTAPDSGGSADPTSGSHSSTGEPGAPLETSQVDATGTVATDVTDVTPPGDVPTARLPEADAAPRPSAAPANGETAAPADGDGAAAGASDSPVATPSAPTADVDAPARDKGGDDVDGDDVDDDDGDFDDEDEAPARKGGLLTRQVQVDARMILIIAAVLAIGVGAYVLGQKQAQDAAAPPTTATSTPPATAFTVPKDFIPFDDKETGIQLAVPKDWVAYSTRDLDASYRLLVGVPDAKDNLRVRMNAYSQAVTMDNIKDQQAVVDSIFAQEKIEILAREIPTVNGMPALYYVYKFADKDGEPGFHAHFFVFQGRKMVSLVFEAVPEARFTLLAPVFDQIANSLQVAPGEPPGFLQESTISGATGPATTTAPGAPTTAPAASTPPSSTP
jgi:hypothetical protein